MLNFLLQDILVNALENNASDIHLSVGSNPMIRIDGDLIPMLKRPLLTNEDLHSIASALLTSAQIDRFNKERELDFSFAEVISQKGVQRFRANFSYEKGYPALALRPIASIIRTIRQLGIPEELKEIGKKNSGLFLVTGPTGSGKSTTLSALIEEINLTRSVHIITVEDPIEYLYRSQMALIHQREIGSDTSSFAEALRRAMRQDPDVIMIGEPRDLETISAAVTAAETGHLVLTTLHTRDAAGSIDRMIDVFPPYQQQQVRVQLSSMLLGVLSQQLVPVASGTGRTIATEYLVANNAVRNYIREAKTSQIKNVLQTNSALGMHSMDQNLAKLCSSGMISEKDAIGHAYDVDSLRRYLMG